MDSGTTATPTMATPASPMTTTPVEQGPTSPTMPTEAHTLQGKEGAFQLRATDFQSSEVPHYFLTSGRKWLVCIDGSAESKLGLFHALDLMNAKEDSLILVHAIKKSRSLASRLSHWRGQSSQAESGEGVVTSPEQQQQQLQQPSEEQEPEPDAIKRGKGYLAHAGNLVKQWSDEVKWVTRCLEAKDPREALCDLARDEKVDYIVMGSRGQNPIRSLFMGSVSSYVSSHAPCPVIVIRETEEERREKKAAEQEERKAAASARTEKRKKLRKKKRDEKKAQGPVEATTQLPQSPLQQPDALQQQMLMQQQLLQQPLEPTFQQQQMGAQHMMQQPLESTFQQQVLQQPLEPTFQQQPQQLVSGVATAETAKMMAPPQPEIMGPAGTSAASLGGAGERTIPVMEK